MTERFLPRPVSLARRAAGAFVLIATLSNLAGCTVAYYDLNGRFTATAEQAAPSSCIHTFSLGFDGFDYTNTFGAEDIAQDVQKEQHDHCAAITQAVLAGRGCRAQAVADATTADLAITVRYHAYLSALPKEFLTGMSLGAIPSWGTRPDQYVYTFKTHAPHDTHRYTVDEKSINRLLVTPVFWLTLFMADSDRVYKTALSNDLAHAAAIGSDA